MTRIICILFQNETILLCNKGYRACVKKTALNNELGIYHTQTGAGIGGFFKGLFKKIIPIGKSLIKQGFEAAKPELKKIANKGINAAGNYTMQQVQNLTDRANTKIGVKRRKDALS